MAEQTEKDYLDSISVSQVGKPSYVGPQLRENNTPFILYNFVVSWGETDWHFPIKVKSDVDENCIDEIAKDMFKETVALIAKKVSEF